MPENWVARRAFAQLLGEVLVDPFFDEGGWHRYDQHGTVDALAFELLQPGFEHFAAQPVAQPPAQRIGACSDDEVGSLAALLEALVPGRRQRAPPRR